MVLPSDVVLTLTPPECGTVIAYEWKTGVFVWAQPGPKMTVTGNCRFEDYQVFYNSWDLSDYGISGIDDGPLTVVGGNTYKATGYLGTDWGWFLPKDLGKQIRGGNGTQVRMNTDNISNFFGVIFFSGN